MTFFYKHTEEIPKQINLTGLKSVSTNEERLQNVLLMWNNGLQKVI